LVVKAKLSIIVPYIRDEAAFETTLLSVLENRPLRSEVIVPHDGKYHNPFRLEDEVTFAVNPDAGSLVDLLDTAMQEARGSQIHLISEGIRATPNWTTHPMELFEGGAVGAVAPVVFDLSRQNEIVSAGWTTDRKSIYRPLAAGANEVSLMDCQEVMGPYLCASFWRRDCLAACLEAGIGHCTQAAQLALGYAMKACQIDCRVASGSRMLGTERSFQAPDSGWAARDAQTVRMGALMQGKAGSVVDSMLGLLTSAGSSAGWKRTAGRLVAALMGTRDVDAVQRQLRVARELWSEYERPSMNVLTIGSAQPVQVRRAA
jgi:hypothetical protein